MVLAIKNKHKITYKYNNNKKKLEGKQNKKKK